MFNFLFSEIQSIKKGNINLGEHAEMQSLRAKIDELDKKLIQKDNIINEIDKQLIEQNKRIEELGNIFKDDLVNKLNDIKNNLFHKINKQNQIIEIQKDNTRENKNKDNKDIDIIKNKIKEINIKLLYMISI